MTKIKKSAVVALAVLLLITCLAFGACEEEKRHTSFSMLITYGEGNKQIVTFYPGVNRVYLTIDAPAAELSFYQFCVPQKDKDGEWKFAEDYLDYLSIHMTSHYLEHEKDSDPSWLASAGGIPDYIYPDSAIELVSGKGIYVFDIEFDAEVKSVPSRKIHLEIKLADIDIEE